MAVTTKSQLQKEAELPKLRGNRYIAKESICMSIDEKRQRAEHVDNKREAGSS